MKRLIFSDLHLHTWSYGATVDASGFNSRLWAQRNALQEILDYVDEHGIKWVYFCGDLFHTHGRVPTQALQVAAWFFNSLKDRNVMFRAIYGNHDMDDRQGSIHALKWLGPNVIKGRWDDELQIHACPYTEDEDTLKRFLGEIRGKSMVMLHQGVAGVPLGSGWLLDEKLNPDMIPDEVTAFTGHYHFYKRVTPNLTVVGNLTPLNWADIDQDKGFLVWDDETGEIEQVIQKSASKFISVNGDADVANAFVRWSDEISQKDQEEVRNELLGKGALTVEFPYVKLESRVSRIRRGEDITAEHLADSFETEDMEPRRLEVGRAVREERYELPETK